MWAGIGAALLGLGALGLIGMYTWASLAGSGPTPQVLWTSPSFILAVILLWVAVGIGGYGLLAPFLGLPLPPTRNQPIWRRKRRQLWGMKRIKAPPGSVPTVSGVSGAPSPDAVKRD